jgi:hypothetical protein
MEGRRAADERKERVRLRYPLEGGGFIPPFAAVGVARASRPLGRGHPARAWRERDAPETAGGTPALQEPSYRVTYLPVDREGLLNLAGSTDH